MYQVDSLVGNKDSCKEIVSIKIQEMNTFVYSQPVQ